jgi:hypothetical protein
MKYEETVAISSSVTSGCSKLEPASEIHDMEGIILLLDLTQPLNVLPIYLLHRRAIHRIVGVWPRILQVLAILHRCFEKGSAQIAYAVVHMLVKVLVVPADNEERWVDGARAVGRVRGWRPMREDVGLKRFKVEGDHGVLVFLVQLVAKCLPASQVEVSEGR